MSKASIQERKEFLKNRVNPILEVLVADLMKDRPQLVVRYIIDWLNDKGEAQEEESLNVKNDTLRPEGVEDSSEDEDEEEGDEVEALPMPTLKTNVDLFIIQIFKQKKILFIDILELLKV